MLKPKKKRKMKGSYGIKKMSQMKRAGNNSYNQVGKISDTYTDERERESRIMIYVKP